MVKLLYLSDFIRHYGKNPSALKKYHEYREIFTINRIHHNSSMVFNGGYIQWDRKCFLREPTVKPLVWDNELKPGYHWVELIH